MTQTWSARWDRIKANVTLRDLLVDVTGKLLVALGVGALLASWLAPYAAILILGGLALSALVKAKHWKRFWA